MRTLGLIGGLSWYSTIVYYRTMNELVAERLGAGHSARLLMYSVDFQDFRTLQDANDWPAVERLMTGIAQRLEQAGAEALVLCTNTPHVVAEGVQAAISIPLLHIADATAAGVRAAGLSRVCLLGTRFTMEHGFFKDRLAKHGIEVMIPAPADREFVHGSIFNELTKGVFSEATRQRYLNLIGSMARDGAEGVVQGCTEIGLLLPSSTSPIPAFDTAMIHARAAVEFALKK